MPSCTATIFPARSEIAVQKRFAGGAELNRHDFARQIFRRSKTAVRLHDEDLGVVIIGLGDHIAGFLHAVEDRHARPHAVALHGVELHQLLIPVDAEDLQLPAQRVADGLADLHVKAGVLAVVAQIAEGRVLRVDAHDEAGSGGGRLLGGSGGGGGSAAGAQREDHRKGQQQSKQFFHRLSSSDGIVIASV